MNQLKVTSVAPTASRVEDRVINETSSTRLIFRPLIVDNKSNPEANLKGSLIFQKKDSNGEYSEKEKAFDLTHVKKGQYVKIDLDSKEVLVLLKEFEILREVYKKHGLNFGENSYSITEGNIADILEKISKFENKGKLLEALHSLQNEDIGKLSLMISLSKIEKILKVWEENKSNSPETFWQNKFKENSWVLSQIFACPYIFIEDQPYLGGKSVSDAGGVKSDFLMKQNSSNNIAFIEIKSPTTKLMNESLYRGKNDGDSNSVYGLSDESTGAINQILNQIDVFTESKISLGEPAREFRNPKGVLIIGSKSSLTEGQIKSFDLFRSNLPGIELITFDEIFERIKLLKEIFLE